MAFGEGLANRFIFPAPEPSYGAQSYKRHLCWIPWNAVISPDRARDERWSDGIPCLWFPAPKAASVIVFFHANAEDLGMSFTVLKHMRDQFKVNVLAVEYPGYGLLHGMMPSEDGVYEVSLTAFRYLVDAIGVRYSQIILFGRSLGSGPAVYLAAQYPVGGLILVSAFSSIRAAVQSIVGRLLAWTFKERFANIRIIANVSCSTLFIHGGSDGLIPADHSLRLFKRCRARKLLITPPTMEHNSNLFGDASFLAVPAIHFFGFPGYYTTSPPRLPACLFENPDRRRRLPDGEDAQASGFKPWLCDCLGKSDSQTVDVSFCRPERSGEGAINGEQGASKLNGKWAEQGEQGEHGGVRDLRDPHDDDDAMLQALDPPMRRHLRSCEAPLGDDQPSSPELQQTGGIAATGFPGRLQAAHPGRRKEPVIMSDSEDDCLDLDEAAKSLAQARGRAPCVPRKPLVASLDQLVEVFDVDAVAPPPPAASRPVAAAFPSPASVTVPSASASSSPSAAAPASSASVSPAAAAAQLPGGLSVDSPAAMAGGAQGDGQEFPAAPGDSSEEAGI